LSSPSIKLYRLRGVFVVYFVVKSIVGALVARSVLRPEFGTHFGWRGFPGGPILLFSLMVAALVLLVALLIFSQLLLRKNWARVLLLVIAWLTVVSAVFSLLASAHFSEMGSWISRWLPEMDWEKLMQFDRIQKVFELLFWGYLISVLQFDPKVTQEFHPRPASGEADKE
jgi:hypothetical protein